MSKTIYKDFNSVKNVFREEKRAVTQPSISQGLGEGIKMTAQEHSMEMNDGETNPHLNALQFDAPTNTDMGHIK